MLAEGFERYSEFQQHKALITFSSRIHSIRGYIAIHRASARVPSFGATRIHSYKDDNDAINDALRLAKLMSYKSAMAELPYGGAKAVITQIDKSKEAFRDYGSIVDTLRGLFVTGADVGVSVDDVKQMRRSSNYIVGTTSNPVRYTVEGVCIALDETIHEVGARKNELTIAIQGIGATGSGILESIHPHVKKIYITDVDEKKLTKYKGFDNVEIVSSDSLLCLPVDVLMPCALAHSINKKTIKSLQTKMIVGSANNQLESEEMAFILHKKNILYAPDYVVNAGGLIAVTDEYVHSNHRIRRIQKKLNVISRNMQKIFRRSKQYDLPTAVVANRIAEKRFNDIQ